MNEFIGIVLDVATDPARAGEEGAEIRERLRCAELLVLDLASVSPPDPAEIAEVCRRRAGEVSLADYVIEGRT